MKVAPHTEHLFAGVVVKFRRAPLGVWFCQKNLARELRGSQNLAERGCALLIAWSGVPLSRVFVL